MADAIVIGSGPNGLAAAVVLAQAGLSVVVYEKGTIGGGTRTEELTLPGFRHDVCSAVHPLGIVSPFLSTLPLHEHGLEWVHPDVPLAHPFDDGTTALLQRSPQKTADALDDSGYLKLMSPLVERWPLLADDVLGPLHWPRHPLLFTQFGLRALLPANRLSSLYLKNGKAKALFAGMAAHSFLPLDRLLSGAFGLMLGALGHIGGWPVARGGSQAIPSALQSLLEELGGRVETGVEIKSLDELSPALITILNVTPWQFLRLAGDRLPAGYRRKLKSYRYGPGVFKIDWALAGPIPWRSSDCLRSATVHLGGEASEIAAGEAAPWQGFHAEKPFVLVVQPTLFDPTRAPTGKHVGWAYCHVPNGSTIDMTDRIEAQMERFAPGFKDLVLARHTRNALQYEEYNPNCIGGDINGGVQDLRQFLARPTLFSPYRTPLSGVYLASSGTPPGGGVHGMAGFHAARTALQDLDYSRRTKM